MSICWDDFLKTGDTIWEEQCYLLKLPRNYVISLLRTFHPRYENEYFNIKEIVELQNKAIQSID